MKKHEDSASGDAGKGQKAREDRAERSARALRDNLRRRKMQARGRESEGATEQDASSDSVDASGVPGRVTDDT